MYADGEPVPLPLSSWYTSFKPSLLTYLVTHLLIPQIGAALGWPVVADVLSGLRVGAPRAPPQGPAAAAASPGGAPAGVPSSPQLPGSPYDNALPLVHHMDHVLLGDRLWWGQLRPDLILQLGPHLTSKRLSQFMVGDGRASSLFNPRTIPVSIRSRLTSGHCSNEAPVMERRPQTTYGINASWSTCCQT